MRIAARRIGSFVEADAAQVEALRDIARQLVGVARNINQIAKSANRTREPDFRAFMEERAALGRQLAAVQGQTQAILDLARGAKTDWRGWRGRLKNELSRP